MRRCLIILAALSSILLASCAGADGQIQSVYTDLTPGVCKNQVDKTDPNDTTYLLCPGVGGYGLIVRSVDAGRQSVEVVSPAGGLMPLNYQDFVTRHMWTLGEKAEWRVAVREGKQTPVALIVRVGAHEDSANPEKVTTSYLAIAKVTPKEVCVTDSVLESAQSHEEILKKADLAGSRQCAPPLPPLTAGGLPIH